MKKSLVLLILMFLTLNVMANNNISKVLSEFAWKKRQLIVFTPSIDHEQYQLYKQLLVEFHDELIERKLLSWHVMDDTKVLLNSIIRDDINPQDFRDAYAVKKGEFRLILVGYDGNEKLRQQEINIDNVFSEIDQMPIRIQEMQSN